MQNSLRVAGQPDRPVVTTPLAAETPPAPVYEEETPTAVPEPAPEEGAAQPVYHTVLDGDTLYSICRKRGFELSEVMALNHGLDAELILEGQTILLPSGSVCAHLMVMWMYNTYVSYIV